MRVDASLPIDEFLPEENVYAISVRHNQNFDLRIKDKKGIENGVADHLSRMRVDPSLPIDDSLFEDNVYAISV
ncbi:unnamed protein product [Cochlearia groenlandica]